MDEEHKDRRVHSTQKVMKAFRHIHKVNLVED